MAALLIAMSVMAILLTVALPTWRQTLQREREEELVFRGSQYARAIGFYQRKYANASPPTLDVLIEQRFLRKKFKDPMSPNDSGEFELLHVGAQGTSGQGNAGTVVSRSGSGAIMGVASKSTAESIRVFNGKTHYNEWEFVALQQSSQAGAPQQGQGQGRSGGTQQQPQGAGGSQGEAQGRGSSQTQGR